jgi:hypothetical protein
MEGSRRNFLTRKKNASLVYELFLKRKVGLMTEDPKKNRKSLTDDSIKSRRGVSRRALLLGAVGGGAAVATAAYAATDSDTGTYADPVGRGYTGMTDNDDGSYADAAGHGRGSGGRRSGITDADNGSVYNQPGYGRGGT